MSLRYVPTLSSWEKRAIPFHCVDSDSAWIFVKTIYPRWTRTSVCFESKCAERILVSVLRLCTCLWLSPHSYFITIIYCEITLLTALLFYYSSTHIKAVYYQQNLNKTSIKPMLIIIETAYSSVYAYMLTAYTSHSGVNAAVAFLLRN